jgi:UDP-4-amino-4,6-dideoxy-N-acetyl-beta-L-altrosamine N-acetyltransferase
MKIIKYGIVLQSIHDSELELIRNWRNSNHVRTNMEYQSVISPAMQSEWFNSLDRSKNLYFMIIKDSIKVGLVNLKNVDINKKNAEAGIFIGDSNYLNSMIPLLTTLAIMEFAFEVLELKTLKAKIADFNLNAILFNESLGYRKSNQPASENFSYYEVNAGDFYSSISNIKHSLEKMGKETLIFLSNSEKENFDIRTEAFGNSKIQFQITAE